MNYTLLAVIAVLAAVLVDSAVLRTRVLRHRVFWTSYAIVLGCQLVVNGLLTGLPVVRYAPDRILGWRLVYAPIEDLLFGFAMVTVTISLWVWWGRRVARAVPPPTRAARPPHAGAVPPAHDG